MRVKALLGLAVAAGSMFAMGAPAAHAETICEYRPGVYQGCTYVDENGCLVYGGGRIGTHGLYYISCIG